MKNIHPRILQPTESYVTRYPEFIGFAEEQEKVFWPSTEVRVDKDLHDLKVNLTPSELHGVTTVLKLFTKYEVQIGEDYWTGFIMKNFPRPEIQRMAALFGMFELNIHAPFYNKINQVLGLDTDEFYTDYVNDPVLAERMRWLEELLAVKASCPLEKYKVVAISSIVEGAILYSSFAFLKHFQMEGKNKLVNLNAGIDFSIRDENIHSLAGATLARTLERECGFTTEEKESVVQDIVQACIHVQRHEYQIIDKIFEKGPIDNITSMGLKQFVDSRINLCLQQLGLRPLFNEYITPIDRWFYNGIQLSSFNDIFQKQGNEYHRDWPEKEFVW